MPSTNPKAAVRIEHFLDNNAPALALVPDIAEVPGNDHFCTPVHDVVHVKKSFRRPKFTLHDDIIVTREVREFRAHVSIFGEVHATFAEAAQHANNRKNIRMPVAARSIQNRYKKIQRDHCSGETRSRRMSGFGEEHTGENEEELHDLLTEMGHVRKDLDERKKTEKTAKD